MVLDSAAIAALFFRDPHSEKVEAAVGRYANLYTLDLAFAEVCSVAWKRVKFFGEELETASRALALAKDFVDSSCRVAQSRELLQEALRLAVEQGTTAYDSLFLSLALKSKMKLLTTDEKLHKKAESSSRTRGLTVMP